MPAPTLAELTQDENLLAIAGRLSRMPPGLVITTGQSRSGKMTMLLALAQVIAQPGERVVLLADRPDSSGPFLPLSEHWEEIHVEPSAKGWDTALGLPAVSLASVRVIAALGRENVEGLASRFPGQWVLATLDTPLIGLDAAYASYEMGLDNDRFVESVRGVWSQFLVETLCPQCAAPARLSPAEMDYLFPAGPFLHELKTEVGCAACGGKGTNGRVAVCEVLLIGDPSRPAIARALLEGTALRLAPEWHFTAQEHARQLVARGEIGVGTYRDAIRRNPLLRAQNMIEREQSRAFKLDLASRHKSEFLANMSHELRTPLNAVIGFSEVLASGMAGPVTEKQREFVGDIHESGKHLLSLINDILDLSKIEAGKMELDVKTFDLPSALDNALTLVRGRAERHGIQLEADIAAAVGECAADERKVKQIVLNLLTNAVKFTPEGGRVTLCATRADGAYELSVKDTGIGIAEEDLERIFEEFQQVGTDSARKAEGTGLGLSLTRRLVELHGGTIRVASIPGEGSTFRFTLPIDASSGRT
jgi:signal transduction histidine kinase